MVEITYKLMLRCSICEQVKQSEQTLEELENVEADEICPLEFICKECIKEME